MNKVRHDVWSVCGQLLLGIGCLSVGAAWSAETAKPASKTTTSKTMTVEQQTVVNITVPPSDLKVDVYTDRQNGIYTEGERARLFLKVNQTARVELVDINSAGVKTVLFPNACQPNNVVAAGQTVEVGAGQNGNTSCSISVSSPYGLSVLKAIATTDQAARMASSSLKSGGAPFGQISETAQSYARTMSVIVTQTPAAKWATSSFNYSVAPRPMPAVGGVIQAQDQQVPGSTQVTVTTGATSSGGTVQVTVPSASSVQVVGQGAVQAGTTTQIAPAFSLPSFGSDFGLQVVVGEAAYKAGDKLTFSVSAERRCDLRVLNINHKGDVSVLYPNALHSTVTLEAGKTEFFPSSRKDVELKLSGEAGTQTLLAVCAQNRSFWEVITGKSAQAVAKPTMSIEEILTNKGDGMVARKAVTYALNP